MRTSLFALQGPMIAARELGFFEKEGLPPADYRMARGSTEQLQELLDGLIDVGSTAADNLIAARQSGHPVRIFHVADLGLDQAAVAGRGIRTWGDVAGHAIGVDSALSGYAYVLYRMLADEGVSRSEVEILALGGPEPRFQALLEGRVAAAMLNPFFTQRARREGLVVLGEGADRFPEYPNLVFAAREDALAADPERFAAYARAVDAGVAWAIDDANADELVGMIAAARGLEQAAARALYEDERRLRRTARPDGAAVRRALSAVAELRERSTGSSLPPEEFATPGALGG